MEIIELAKQLGEKIQEENEYINFRISQQEVEADQTLQNKIKEFNEKKIALNEQMAKEEFNQETINEINDSLRSLYEELMQDEKMIKYNQCRQILDNLIIKINVIINEASEGRDSSLEHFGNENSCSGSCCNCPGC